MKFGNIIWSMNVADEDKFYDEKLGSIQIEHKTKIILIFLRVYTDVYV